jgi:phage terminase small subunit
MTKITALKTAIPSKTERKSPKHLKKAGRNLWESVAGSYVLEDHHFVLLTTLCETLDRKIQAQDELAEAGSLTFENRYGESKAHAAVAIVRDCSVLIARLTRELNLSEEGDDNRPPPLRYSGRK